MGNSSLNLQFHWRGPCSPGPWDDTPFVRFQQESSLLRMSKEGQNYNYIMDVNGGEGDWSNIHWRLRDRKFYRECGRWGAAGSSSTRPWNNSKLDRSRSRLPANQHAGPAVEEVSLQGKMISFFCLDFLGPYWVKDDEANTLRRRFWQYCVCWGEVSRYFSHSRNPTDTWSQFSLKLVIHFSNLARDKTDSRNGPLLSGLFSY